MALGFQVTFDSANPKELAEFWADALGYIVQPPPKGYESWEKWAAEQDISDEMQAGWGSVVDPEGKGARILFPEGKSVKNRVHLDLNASSAGRDVDQKSNG